MKKYLFMASAAMLFLASCSSDSEEAVVNNNPVEENDLVKIELNANRLTAETTTRAAVEAGDAVKGAGLYILSENNSWDAIAATPSALIGMPTDFRLSSAATLIANAEINIAATTGEVSFADSKSYYYPQSSENNYAFYVYNPYDADASLDATAQTVTISDAPFDGSQDIMFGKSVSVTDGWNAKYARTNAPDKAQVELEHLTAQIAVSFKEGAGYKAITSYPVQSWIEVPSKYDLVFDAAANAALTFDPTDKANAMVTKSSSTLAEVLAGEVYKNGDEYYVLATEGVVAGATQLDATITTLTLAGYSILVPATENGTTAAPDSYVLKICFPGEEANPQDVTIKAPTTGAGTGKFEAGKKYSVTVKINGPQKIEAEVTIAAWDNVDLGEIDF